MNGIKAEELKNCYLYGKSSLSRMKHVCVLVTHVLTLQDVVVLMIITIQMVIVYCLSKRRKKMNESNAPTACKEQEIPAEIKRNETLVKNTFELLEQLESKINPVLSCDCLKSESENEKTPQLESQIGNWLNDQNRKLESVNEVLRDLCQRVRL